MAFASANLTTGQVSLVQAGHPNPVLIPAHGPPEFIGNGGFPIGLLPDAPYQKFNITLNTGGPTSVVFGRVCRGCPTRRENA